MGTQRPPSNNEPGGGNDTSNTNDESEDAPGQSTDNAVPAPQQPARNNLLYNIFSHHGDAEPEA